MPPLSASARARLPASAFAYVDAHGRRRLPIHDAAHVRNALARFDQTVFDDLATNTLRVYGRDLFVFAGGTDQGNPSAATTLVRVRRKP